VLFVALAIAGVIWHFGRSNTLLERWAQRHGYRIIAQEYRTFFKGPYFWTTSRNQTVYRVTILDEHGDTRSGWVRCGGWFMGLWSDHVDVQWDD
jgi:hypothetical protein